MLPSSSPNEGVEKRQILLRRSKIPQAPPTSRARRGPDATLSCFPSKDTTQGKAGGPVSNRRSSLQRKRAACHGAANAAGCILEESSIYSDSTPIPNPVVTIDQESDAAMDARVHGLVERICEQHLEILKLCKEVEMMSARVENGRRREKEINRLLDRCSVASHALWNKNVEREQRIEQLREKLRSLKTLHDPNFSGEMFDQERTKAKELKSTILTALFS